MKKLLWFSLLSISFVFGQIKSINANNFDELMANEGKIISVRGKIVNTALSTTGKAHYLNFGEDHTKSFTGVIFSRHLKNFEKKEVKPLEYYLNKEVIMMGKIKIFNEKPEIIIAFPKQITIVNEEN